MFDSSRIRNCLTPHLIFNCVPRSHMDGETVTGSAGAAQIADPGKDRMWKGTLV